MTASLHDTLGNANPHYTMRQGRKLQLEKQPEKAMEARKTAMVEASWCKILNMVLLKFSYFLFHLE
jgi:hypothetical protein